MLSAILEILDDECIICTESLNNNKNIKITKCKHIFHDQCLNEWFYSQKTPTCPICRETFERKSKRQLCGLSKLIPVSKKYAQFAGCNEGDLYTRFDVLRYICTYIEEHDLQDPNNKRVIIPDEKLANLLNYNPSDGDLFRYNLLAKMRDCFN